MNDRHSKIAYWVASAAALASCSNADEPQGPYNIVYIMTDDHTAQMMSCYDRRYIETPNLDRIARDGVRFTNSFVANSLSGPSRACMLTGKHSSENRFFDNSTCVFDAEQKPFGIDLRKVFEESRDEIVPGLVPSGEEMRDTGAL